MNTVIPVIQALVRPLLTVSFAALFIITGITGDFDTIPDRVQIIGETIILFWFAGRVAEKMAVRDLRSTP